MSEPTTKELVSIQQHKDYLRKGYFWSFLIGSIFILGSTFSKGFDLAFILPVFVMFAYIRLAKDTARKYHNEQDFADSVYYLGFIFTLISLAAAVISEKLTGGGGSPTETLSFFGTALVTTIYGIGYRSYFMQFTNLSNDPIDIAGVELREETEKFRESVNQLQIKIEEVTEKLTSQLPQKLEDSVNQFDEKFNSASNILSNNMNELVSSTEDISRKTKQSFSNLHDSINTSTQNISTMAQTIENASNENIKNLSDSTKKVSRVIDTSLDSYSNKLSSSIEQMSEATKKVSQVMDTSLDSYSNKLSSSIEQMSVATSSALSEMKKVQEHISSYSNQLASNSESNLLRTTLDSLEKSNDDFIVLSDKIKDTASSWDRTNDSFEEATQTLRKEIDKIKDMFKEMASLDNLKIK